jgi:hypothetical protein
MLIIKTNRTTFVKQNLHSLPPWHKRDNASFFYLKTQPTLNQQLRKTDCQQYI